MIRLLYLAERCNAAADCGIKPINNNQLAGVVTVFGCAGFVGEGIPTGTRRLTVCGLFRMWYGTFFVGYSQEVKINAGNMYKREYIKLYFLEFIQFFIFVCFCDYWPSGSFRRIVEFHTLSGRNRR